MFTGTGRLIRLALRRDRIKLPVWILLTVGFLAMMIPAVQEAYPAEKEWAAIAATLSSSAVGKLFAGNMDEISFGAIITAETLLYIGLIVAFMNTLLVVRHTRHNEEVGSSELLQSAQVGRFAPLTAALTVALGANILVAVGCVLAIGVSPELSQSGGWLYGAAMGLFGLSFAAIAGITAQLSGSARGANSMAALVIGAAFLLRGIGDMFANDIDGKMWPLWTSWFSPFGWLQLTRPLTLEDWWALGLFAVFIVLALPVAYVLLTKRDVGFGILPARKGKPRASAALLRQFGLAVRLQKGAIIGWGIAVAVTAVTLGAMANSYQNIADESEVIQQYLAALGGTGELAEIFMSAMLAFAAILVIAYALQALHRLRGEENSGHLESLLGTAEGRTNWVLGHVLVVATGVVLLLFVCGLLMAVSGGLSAGTAVSEWGIGSYLAAALSYVPAVLLFISIVVFCFGVLPKVTTLLAWAAFALLVFVSQFGGIITLPAWLLNLSPFHHLSAPPSEAILFEPLAIMTALAVVLTVAGLAAFTRRSITTT